MWFVFSATSDVATKMENGAMNILFYTSVPRLFRSTGIGHLYELAQVHQVTLLSEELDAQTEKILADKRLFPKLEKIIPVRQYTGKRANILKEHYFFSRLAKQVVRQYKPDVLIADDIHPFDLYLMRYATRQGVLKVSFQLGIQPAPMKECAFLPMLRSVYTKNPLFLPFWIRVLLVKTKKRLGHVLHYWLCPLLVGKAPFIGTSSFILWKGDVGSRQTDYYLVLAKRDRDLCIQAGVSQKKLYVLPHPFFNERTKKFLERAYELNTPPLRRSQEKRIAVMMPAEDMGIKKSDHSLISQEETKTYRVGIIKLLDELLEDWQIIIKPHPATKNLNELKEILLTSSPAVTIVNPHDPADTYIASCNVIMGFVPSSTTLFTASLQCPEKPIISLDLQHELLGDTYKEGFAGIEYIDTEEDFVKILVAIRNKTYKKDPAPPEQADFPDAVQAIEYLSQLQQ